MKIILVILVGLITLVPSCSRRMEKQFNMESLPNDWIRLSEQGGELVIYNSCDAGNLLLTIQKEKTQHHILLHGQQEDQSFSIVEFYEYKDTVFFNTELSKQETAQVFKFVWLDKQHGIANWSTTFADGLQSDFTFVSKEYQNQFEQIDQPCRECWGDECDELKDN